MIQSTSVYSDDTELTADDLSDTLLLLIYSDPVVKDTYYPDKGARRKSFKLVKKLYNGVTNTKNVHSEIIVSYSNSCG